MLYLWIGLFVVIVLFAIRYVLLLQGLRHIKQQLSQIRHAGFTNQRISNPHHFAELRKFVELTNEFLAHHFKQSVQHTQLEEELKTQMTNISHDIRTPLASILGFFQLLKEEDTTEKEREQYMAIIEKRATLLYHLLDNYYDLIRTDKEVEMLKMESLSINDVFLENLMPFYYDFKNQGIDVDFQEANSFVTVLGDKKMLQRVFVNLIQNVLVHGKSQFIVSHYPKQTILKNQFAAETPIEVDKLFNRLYSGDTSRHLGNTGIGLTVAKALLEKMGHHITATVTDNWFIISIEWK